jgi:all-trans-8'-apo-beta-carotenal 15,15'-oxygenase
VNLSRRAILGGTAALAAATIIDPETAFAAAANSGDWTLGFADVEADVASHAMRLVSGRAPAQLSGVLYRNGPAKFRRPGLNATHWFDGDGLMRRFQIGEGRATAQARFADTPKRRQEAAAGAMIVPGFGSPGRADARIESNDDVNAANTSVMAAGDKVWALWEGGSPFAMDATTLASEGIVALRADLKAMPFSAHPRYEPDGRIWNFGLNRDKAFIWRLGRDGALEDAQMVPIGRASYFHDFTATERHLVIVLQPWMHESFRLPLIGGFVWRPELGTQVLVIDKNDLSQRRVYELPAFSAFHLGDAWEERDGTIRFDICTTPDPTFGAQTASDLLVGKLDANPPAVLARIALGPDGKGRYEVTDTIAEFPKSDPRFAGKARTLTFHTWGKPGRFGQTPSPQGVASSNFRTGTVDHFDFGLRHLVEEPIFVARPGSSAEGDGWLVATSLNLDARATELHAFDARHIGRGPVESWRADVALPLTFHGTFVPA